MRIGSVVLVNFERLKVDVATDVPEVCFGIKRSGKESAFVQFTGPVVFIIEIHGVGSHNASHQTDNALGLF